MVLARLKGQHGRVYLDATTWHYRLDISYDWNHVGRWLMLGPDTVHAFFQDADHRTINFMLSNRRPWLSLEMSSSQEVVAFVAAFEEKYVGAFRVSKSLVDSDEVSPQRRGLLTAFRPYTIVKAYFKNT